MKRRTPPETGKDPAEMVDKGEIPTLKNAQSNPSGEGMSHQTEGSNQNRTTGRKGK